MCSLEGSYNHASLKSRVALIRKWEKVQNSCKGCVRVLWLRTPAQGLSSLADLCPGYETAESNRVSASWNKVSGREKMVSKVKMSPR